MCFGYLVSKDLNLAGKFVHETKDLGFLTSINTKCGTTITTPRGLGNTVNWAFTTLVFWSHDKSLIIYYATLPC
jgi:hypothetical protein